MKKFLFAAGLLFFAAQAYAQKLDISDRWLMNDRLLDLIDSYERYSSFENRSDAYSFVALFRSPESKIWCDYIASGAYGNMITAKEYADYSRELEDRSVKISRLKKSDLVFRDGRWRVNLEFDKQVEYEDSLGFTFSTRSSMIGGDSHIVMECVWMPDREEFLIENLRGSLHPSSTFPEGKFHIVEQKNEIDANVRYGRDKLSFNEYGFAIVPEGEEFRMDDDDIVLMQNRKEGTERYDIMSFATKQVRWRARAHAAYAPMYIVGSDDAHIRHSSTGFSFGGEIGYAFLGKRSFKMLAYTGLELTFNNIALSLADPVSYSVLAQDYKITAASEGISIWDFSIPMFLSFEQNIGRKFCIVADLGLKFNMNLAMNQQKYSLTYVLNKDTAHPQTQQFDSFINPNKNEINPWGISFFGKAGADYAFMKGKYVYLRAGYELGLYPGGGYAYSPAVPTSWYSSGSTSQILPLVYRIDDAGKMEQIAVHSFLGSINFKRSGFILEVGVRFKF